MPVLRAVQLPINRSAYRLIAPGMERSRVMINAKHIKLERAEGRHEECITVEVEGERIWEQANAVLNGWSVTAPKRGYNKCDFTVTYEDGETYEGRYDLKHFTIESANLARHIRDFLECYSFRRKPAHLTDKNWAEFQKNHIQYDADAAKNAGLFLDTYQIGV